MQEGWKLETRQRQSGKCQGQIYKVFYDAKGKPFYSKKAAVDAGYRGMKTPKRGELEQAANSTDEPEIGGKKKKGKVQKGKVTKVKNE